MLTLPITNPGNVQIMSCLFGYACSLNALVVKALALSKVQFLASPVALRDYVIKEVSSMIYEFTWNDNNCNVN